jgi:Holliday junction resolvase RusA-like endonuclease
LSTTLRVTYPPSANHSHYSSGALKKHVSDWRRTAAWAYKAAGGKLLEGPVSIEVDLYKPATKTPYDVDNALRNLLNALKGVAYHDDDQVYLLVVAKMWPDGQGHAVMRVKKLGPVNNPGPAQATSSAA